MRRAEFSFRLSSEYSPPPLQRNVSRNPLARVALRDHHDGDTLKRAWGPLWVTVGARVQRTLGLNSALAGVHPNGEEV